METMTTVILSEAEFQRRTRGLTRDEITETHDAESRERFVKAIRANGGHVKPALRIIGRNGYWFDSQMKGDSRFRQTVLGLIPSRRMEPVPTEFGRFCLQCPKVRERVAFVGDIAIPDIQAIALVAAERHHFPFAVPEVDCIVAGIGADVKALVGYLAQGGIVLGIGTGPQGSEIVSTPSGRFFRMRL
jgi:hypothetical protein